MSNYIHPEAVVSPRHNWTLIAVLDVGNGDDDRGALAIGRWDPRDDNDPVRVVLAMRWNGKDGKSNPAGNPQSRGLPTWFIMPEKYNEAIISTLSPDKVALVRNFLPKKD